MKKMAAGVFKAKCLSVMDTVQRTREPVVITKRGKPIAKLVPAEEPAKSIFGYLKGKMKIVGDIESPVDPPEAWDALR